MAGAGWGPGSRCARRCGVPPDSFFAPERARTWTRPGGRPPLGPRHRPARSTARVVGVVDGLGHQGRPAGRARGLSLAMVEFEVGSLGSVINSLLVTTRAQPDRARSDPVARSSESSVRLHRRELVLHTGSGGRESGDVRDLASRPVPERPPRRARPRAPTRGAVLRADLTPANPFGADLAGGLNTETITRRMAPGHGRRVHDRRVAAL